MYINAIADANGRLGRGVIHQYNLLVGIEFGNFRCFFQEVFVVLIVVLTFAMSPMITKITPKETVAKTS